MMAAVSVVAAAAGAWVFGAVWYMLWSRPWMAANAIRPDSKDGWGSDPTPFIISAVLLLFVAGMVRYMFGLAGIEDFWRGVMIGGGMGLLIAAPWITMNNVYPGRPWVLSLIDGGYATLGTAIIGGVLVLF